MPTQEDDAEELSLQEQVRALHQHLAARDAEVAALKQRESSSTQPAGESSPAVEKKKVPSVQPGLGAFWKMPMTKSIGASYYQHPCLDEDRGTVKVCGRLKVMPIPSLPTGAGPAQLGRCAFPLCQKKGQCPLPDVTDKTELNKLVGQKILYAFDDDHYGWYIGTIFSTNLTARDLKHTPRANCVVTYRKSETKVTSLGGKVACKLSKHPYGVDQWWVLLKKKT